MGLVYLDIGTIVRCNHWDECSEASTCEHGDKHIVIDEEDCGDDCSNEFRPRERRCFCVEWKERKDWDE